MNEHGGYSWKHNIAYLKNFQWKYTLTDLRAGGKYLWEMMDMCKYLWESFSNAYVYQIIMCTL